MLNWVGLIEVRSNHSQRPVPASELTRVTLFHTYQHPGGEPNNDRIEGGTVLWVCSCMCAAASGLLDGRQSLTVDGPGELQRRGDTDMCFSSRYRLLFSFFFFQSLLAAAAQIFRSTLRADTSEDSPLQPGFRSGHCDRTQSRPGLNA